MAPVGAAGAGPTTGPRGLPIGPDLGRWQYWWEFNKDRFLRLKEAIRTGGLVSGSDQFFMGGSRRAGARDTLASTEADVRERILPALRRALEATDQRDVVSSCLVAMAKVGGADEGTDILPSVRERLRHRDQEIRETAAIALGIAQTTRAIPDLLSLVTDDARGRALCGRARVDDRTRAFACYGLGLAARATPSAPIKRMCLEALARVLGEATKPLVDRNLPVAAIHGIRLLQPGSAEGTSAEELRAACVAALWSYYEKRAGPAEELVQAHVPPAVAQLLGRGHAEADRYKKRLAGELAGRYGNRSNEITQSAAIALGLLCEPPERRPADEPYGQVLLRYALTGTDEQTRSFCLMALGRIGGARNRGELLRVFASGGKALVKPWAAMALGVLAQDAAEAGVIDAGIGRELQRGLGETKNNETRAAIAVALGLCKFGGAAEEMRALLVDSRQKDELAGYLCIGLSLLGDDRSTEEIRTTLESSLRRPELFQQAAIALGKLGDKSAAELLQTMLRENRSLVRLGAIAAALGHIGDRRSIDPLIEALHDPSLTALARAFAAVALGGVGDPELLPWNAKIAADINYRASVETLADGISGILDIL